MPAVEPRADAGRSKRAWLALSVLPVAFGIAGTLLSFLFAPTSSDTARAWGGLVPVAYVGLVGLRRTRPLLKIAGALFSVATVVAGVVLLQMHHSSAGVLIVLGAIGGAEALLLARKRRASTSS